MEVPDKVRTHRVRHPGCEFSTMAGNALTQIHEIGFLSVTQLLAGIPVRSIDIAEM
jgi:hypothetical protein